MTDWQYNDQKKRGEHTNNDLQNIKDWSTRTLQNIEESVSSSSSTPEMMAST
jgi:hypothetical protein